MPYFDSSADSNWKLFKLHTEIIPKCSRVKEERFKRERKKLQTPLFFAVPGKVVLIFKTGNSFFLGGVFLSIFF